MTVAFTELFCIDRNQHIIMITRKSTLIVKVPVIFENSHKIVLAEPFDECNLREFLNFTLSVNI